MGAARTWALGFFFTLGVALTELVPPSSLWFWGAGAAGAALAIMVWLLHRKKPQGGVGDLLPSLGGLSASMLVLAMALTGYCAAAARLQARAEAFLPSLDGLYTELTGTVSKDPEQRGRALRFIIRVDRAGKVSVREYLEVRAYGPMPAIAAGDRVRAGVRIEALDAQDPFDVRLARNHVVATSTTSGSAIERIRGPGALMGVANAFRSRIEAGARSAMRTSHAGLLLGLTIGDTRLIPAPLVEDFRLSGLSHLMAVSGANVAMVLAALLLLLRAFRLSRAVQIPAAISVLVWFAVVTRWEPSVLRATVMASIGLLAFYAGRRSEGLYALGVAFIVLLAVDPQMLWSVGFQLSFAASAGILLLGPGLKSRMSGLGRPLSEALAVGVSAQLAVTPLLAVHFGKVSLVAIPANLLAFPVVPPATIAGLAAGFLGGAGGWVFEVAEVAVAYLERLAVGFARLPNSSLVVDAGAGALVVGFLLLIAVALWTRGKLRAARWPAAFAAVAWVVSGLASANGSSLPQQLRVTFFDVGQGDAALVESPAGARVLIDGGPDPHLVARKLRSRGIERIDLVVVSHLHSDHVAGLESVARMRATRVWHPGVPGPLIRRLQAIATVEVPSEGQGLQIGDVRIDVLGPSADLLDAASAEEGSIAEGFQGEGSGSALNDASLVLRIGWGSGCVLFTGDLEFEGQRRLLSHHRERIDCTVMKAPHHGSSRVDEGFVQAVDPEIVPVSVGRNTFGHPTRTALGIFERAGAQVARTDRMDDVVVLLGKNGSAILR